MLKVILDTNIVVSHLISKSSNIGKVIDLAKNNQITLISSISCWIEIKNTITKDKIKSKLGNHTSSFLAQYKYACEFIIPTSTVIFNRDPKDAKFLELARDSNANYIVSGDKDLLEFGVFENTKIITLGGFLELYHLN